jgi:hypothetical protein
VRILNHRPEIAIQQSPEIHIRPTQFQNLTQNHRIKLVRQMISNATLEWTAAKSLRHFSRKDGSAMFARSQFRPLTDPIGESRIQSLGVRKRHIDPPSRHFTQ